MAAVALTLATLRNYFRFEPLDGGICHSQTCLQNLGTVYNLAVVPLAREPISEDGHVPS